MTLVAPCEPGSDVEAIQRELAGSCRAELVAVRPRGARGLLASSLLRRRPVTVVRQLESFVRLCCIVVEASAVTAGPLLTPSHDASLSPNHLYDPFRAAEMDGCLCF